MVIMNILKLASFMFMQKGKFPLKTNFLILWNILQIYQL